MLAGRPRWSLDAQMRRSTIARSRFASPRRAPSVDVPITPAHVAGIPGTTSAELRSWYVYGTNGEYVIDATAESQAKAWRLAREQARAVGMVRGVN
jgi:hypothetical protein